MSDRWISSTEPKIKERVVFNRLAALLVHQGAKDGELVVLWRNRKGSAEFKAHGRYCITKAKLKEGRVPDKPDWVTEPIDFEKRARELGCLAAHQTIVY